VGQLQGWAIGTKAITTWFDTSGSQLVTDSGIEDTNAFQFAFTLIENNNGYYMAAVLSQHGAGSGSQSATIAVKCNGSLCSAGQFATATSPIVFDANGSLSLGWLPCCADGFVVGPMATGNSICVTITAISTKMTGEARFVKFDSTTVTLAGSPLNKEICFNF